MQILYKYGILSAMTQETELWTVSRTPLTPDSSHYVDCTPDLYVPDPLNLTADMIASLSVRHVLVDFDGTMAVNGNKPPIADEMIAHMSGLASDERFESFAIATDSSAYYLENIAAQIGRQVGLFQPKETPSGRILKSHPGFYRRILWDTGIWDNPELAVMIGDSPRYDIVAAQNAGIKTILVDRLVKQINPNLRQLWLRDS